MVSPEQSNPVSGLAPAYTYGTPMTEYAAFRASWAPGAGAGGGGGGGGGGGDDVVGSGVGVDPPPVGDVVGGGDDGAGVVVVGLGVAITGAGGGVGGGGGISAIRSFSCRPPRSCCCAATALCSVDLSRRADATAAVLSFRADESSSEAHFERCAATLARSTAAASSAAIWSMNSSRSENSPYVCAPSSSPSVDPVPSYAALTRAERSSLAVLAAASAPLAAARAAARRLVVEASLAWACRYASSAMSALLFR